MTAERTFRIQNTAFENAYLCNEIGQYQNDNLICIWPYQYAYIQVMLWYVTDCQTWRKHKDQTSDIDLCRKQSSSGVDEGEKNAMMAKKKLLDDRMKELDEMEERFKDKERSNETRKRELDAREAKLEERQKAIDRQEKERGESKTDPSGKPKSDGDDNATLKKQLEVAKRELAEAKARAEKSEK